MFEICIKTTFSSAHRLRGYKGSCKNLHGHNWSVNVYIKGNKLDNLGMVKDFRDLKSVINEIVSELDHKDINELPQFRKKNPTSENLAVYLFERFSEKISDKNVKVSKVTVGESSKTEVSYWKE